MPDVSSGIRGEGRNVEEAEPWMDTVKVYITPGVFSNFGSVYPWWLNTGVGVELAHGPTWRRGAYGWLRMAECGTVAATVCKLPLSVASGREQR